MCVRRKKGTLVLCPRSAGRAPRPPRALEAAEEPDLQRVTGSPHLQHDRQTPRGPDTGDVLQAAAPHPDRTPADGPAPLRPCTPAR